MDDIFLGSATLLMTALLGRLLALLFLLDNLPKYPLYSLQGSRFLFPFVITVIHTKVCNVSHSIHYVWQVLQEVSASQVSKQTATLPMTPWKVWRHRVLLALPVPPLHTTTWIHVLIWCSLSSHYLVLTTRTICLVHYLQCQTARTPVLQWGNQAVYRYWLISSTTIPSLDVIVEQERVFLFIT